MVSLVLQLRRKIGLMKHFNIVLSLLKLSKVGFEIVCSLQLPHGFFSKKNIIMNFNCLATSNGE